MKQVYLKRPNLAMGTTDLVRVNVLSENGDKLRVRIPGQFHPKEINAADTQPCALINHTGSGNPTPQKMYQTPGTIARDLY